MGIDSLRGEAMSTFILVFIASYLFHGLGITLGYHRLLSHRSYKVPRLLEYFIVLGGYLSFEGSPVFWVATHRLHHKYSDMPGDPHSPVDGWWHSFVGWMISPRVAYTAAECERLCPDLINDPLYKFLHCGHTRYHALLCLGLCIAFRVAIYLALGPVGLAANLLGAFVPFVGALMVNSFGHLNSLGYQNFATGENSRNIWWVAMLSLGEGWHNNHHALPASARHGILPQEPDLSWAMLTLLRWFGLASDIKLPPEAKLAQAREARASGRPASDREQQLAVEKS